MELMDTSLDKFYRKVLEKNMTIPEDILGEIAVSVSGCGTQEQSQGPQHCPAGHPALPHCTHSWLAGGDAGARLHTKDALRCFTGIRSKVGERVSPLGVWLSKVPGETMNTGPEHPSSQGEKGNGRSLWGTGGGDRTGGSLGVDTGR